MLLSLYPKTHYTCPGKPLQTTTTQNIEVNMHTVDIPHLLIIFSLTLTAPASIAQVFSWKDADGKIHYGDRPPVTQQNARKLQAAPPTDPSAPPPTAGKLLAEREQQQKDQEGAKNTQTEQAEARQRKENCQRARANLAALESGEVRFILNAQGERVALEGATLGSEINRTRQAANSWCAPPAKPKP
jgi:hypothetical protein